MSSSYDQDEEYGGMVVEYELTFNGETFTRTIPEITVAYSNFSNVYDYSCRVKDNNGTYSSAIVDRIILN